MPWATRLAASICRCGRPVIPALLQSAFNSLAEACISTAQHGSPVALPSNAMFIVGTLGKLLRVFCILLCNLPELLATKRWGMTARVLCLPLTCFKEVANCFSASPCHESHDNLFGYFHSLAYLCETVTTGFANTKQRLPCSTI